MATERIKCTLIGKNDDGAAKFIPVQSGSTENDAYFDGTPKGEICIHPIDSTKLAALTIGNDYYIDIIDV